MKNFPQLLLVFLSLCLCALIAFQWVRESRLHQKLQSLTSEIPDKTAALQNLEAKLKRAEDEIARLDRLKTELAETAKTNQAEIFRLSGEVARSQKQIEADRRAIEQANQNIHAQIEEMRKQNDLAKQFSEERNRAVEKYNALATNYDALAKKWNELQEQLKQK